MLTNVTRPAVVALVLGAVILYTRFETRYVADLASFSTTPTMAGPIEMGIVRNVIQHLLQTVRDQIRSHERSAGELSGAREIPLRSPAVGGGPREK
jgi:hypothetical protein